jgi:hypothetical protein
MAATLRMDELMLTDKQMQTVSAEGMFAAVESQSVGREASRRRSKAANQSD